MEVLSWWKEKRQNGVVSDAQNRFQATEYDGELWLTHAGCLVAPFRLITKSGSSEEITSLLGELRKMYIERNT